MTKQRERVARPFWRSLGGVAPGSPAASADRIRRQRSAWVVSAAWRDMGGGTDDGAAPGARMHRAASRRRQICLPRRPAAWRPADILVGRRWRRRRRRRRRPRRRGTVSAATAAGATATMAAAGRREQGESDLRSQRNRYRVCAGHDAASDHQFARRYDLTQLETQSFPLIGTSLYRWRIGGGRTVANIGSRARRRDASSPACSRTTFSRCRKRPPRSPPAAGRCARNTFWRNCKSRKRSKWRPARTSWSR